MTGVTAVAGAASATVSWTPPVSSGGEAITGYVVTSSGGTKADAGPYAITATVTGLTAGSSYTFTVTAQTALGTSVSAATTAIIPGDQTSYTYDPAGNLASSETDGITTTDTYNADEELTSTVTGSATTSYGYDNDGNQTSAGSTSYTYNAANEMTTNDTDAGNFTYSYDSDSDLATTSLDDTEISSTVWDLNNPLPEAAEDTTSTGTVTGEYAWNPDGALNSETVGGATGTGTTYYAVTDWQNSVTGLINTSGTQENDTNYTAYGISSMTGSVTSSIGYAGSYTLTGASLDDMRARDYSPETAQFTTVDFLATQTDLEYAYADDDPAAQTDPSGLCSWYNAYCYAQQQTRQWLQEWDSGWSNSTKCSQIGGSIFVTTPRGTTYQIPDNWVSYTARNGKGIVFQDPNSVGLAMEMRMRSGLWSPPRGILAVMLWSIISTASRLLSTGSHWGGETLTYRRRMRGGSMSCPLTSDKLM